MMRYCNNCGTGHECTEENGREKAEVAIARLETTRDIEVARINATAGVQVAEAEAESGAAHAEGIAEGMAGVIEAENPEPIIVEGETPAPDGEPLPVITEEPGPDMPEPPVVDTPEPPASKGWWDGYR